MTFRHPLRNEWDRMKPRFDVSLQAPGAEGEIARAMNMLVPPFLDLIEDQRDRATSPDDRLTSLFAVIGMLLENAIEVAYARPRERRVALEHMLDRLSSTIGPRLARSSNSAGSGGLIIPGRQ